MSRKEFTISNKQTFLQMTDFRMILMNFTKLIVLINKTIDRKRSYSFYRINQELRLVQLNKIYV